MSLHGPTLSGLLQASSAVGRMSLEAIIGAVVALVGLLAGFARWTINKSEALAHLKVQSLASIVSSHEADLTDLRQQVKDDRADIRQELRIIRELLQDLHDRGPDAG